MNTQSFLPLPVLAKLTLAACRAVLSLLGISLTKTDGEYRVRLVGSPAGHGYFTNDLADTYATGQAMAWARVPDASKLVSYVSPDVVCIGMERGGESIGVRYGDGSEGWVRYSHAARDWRFTDSGRGSPGYDHACGYRD